MNQIDVVITWGSTLSKKLSKMNEFQLAIKHRDALQGEDYIVCHQIQREVDERISKGTIDHSFMNGFKKFDAKTQKFYGEPKFEPFNGLFGNYQYKNEDK